MRLLCHFFLILVAVLMSFSLRAAPPDSADAARIVKLIAQLGSGSFTEREQASKELDAIGLPALEPLKKAAQSPDAETRRRAEELISRIEARQESSRLLAPTRVTLSLQETPLPEAVGQLSRKSGQSIVLGGDAKKYADRKVTLEIKDLPFWQALDEFCAKTGLVEAGSVEMPLQPNLQPGVIRRRPVQLDPFMGPAQASQNIVLTDGKPVQLPTHHAGAARIRALPPDPALAGKSPTEIRFTLGLGLEAQLPLLRLINVRIDKALDDQGQTLESATTVTAPPGPGDNTLPLFIGNAGGLPRAIMGTAGQQPVPIKLKPSEKPSKLLKDLTGVLAVEVRTPPEPVMVVDNILKASGQLVKGKSGGSLKVHDVARQDDGSYKIRVELQTPSDANANNAAMQLQGQGVIRIQVIRINGNVIGGNGGWFDGGDLGLSLVDAQGGKFQLAANPTRDFKFANNVVTHDATLHFKPNPGQGEPAKLLYTTTRPATIEIPFTLKDVPLP